MTLCIIPARLDSTRFPNKVITPIAGRELILKVIDTCLSCDRFKRIVVLAQDQKICDIVLKEFNDKVDARLHKIGESGTHRALDYYYNNEKKRQSVMVVQADNIDLTARDLETVIFHANSINDKSVYTPVCKMNVADACSPSNVKAVIGYMSNILYFSRSCIPHDSQNHWKHIGVYMFPRLLLDDLSFMTYALNDIFNNCNLVKTEKLEQLAWLYYGFSMRAVTLNGYRHSIDTPQDMKSFVKDVYSKQ